MLPDGHAGTFDLTAARMLIRSILARHVRHGVLRPALIDVYRAGWAAGELAAHDAMVRLAPLRKADATPAAAGTATVAVNWDDWTPGHTPAALEASDLDTLIADAVGSNEAWSARAAMRGNLLASIEDNRLSALADALAAALEEGSNVDTFERTIRGILDNTTWSDLVATTEMNRAMTAASLTSYGRAGVDGKEYLTASDMAVCPACAENEDAGPIPLGSSFPNGDPPAHPSCRCALMPAWLDPGEYDPADVGLPSSEE